MRGPLSKTWHVPTKENALKQMMVAAPTMQNMRWVDVKHCQLGTVPHVPWQLNSCTTVVTRGMNMTVVDNVAVARSTCEE